ncbi:MAG: HD domain-containing phosphohydrolase [Pseudomonadota bacterium]
MPETSAKSPKGRVLIIDDEENVLLGLRRQLHQRFDLVLAKSGDEGLAKLREHDPIPVVVCDMNMPGRSGIEVLADIAEQSPDTVRIMLTGQADLTTAMNAVNHGNIFRFYTKPCAADVLAGGLDAGLEQYRLVTAERDLLNKTLAGSIKVLTDVLALIDADSFGRTERARRLIKEVSESLGLGRHLWKLEMATMLAPIGLVALPPGLAKKARSNDLLTPVEREMVDASAATAHKLICNIPRLQEVADYVFYQRKNMDGSGFPDDDKAGRDIPVGARILRIINDFAQSVDQGIDARDTLGLMGKRDDFYDQALLKKIAPIIMSHRSETDDAKAQVIEVLLGSLCAGDVLQSAITDQDNEDLILAKGSTITELYIERLQNLNRVRKLSPKVLVRRNVDGSALAESA